MQTAAPRLTEPPALPLRPHDRARSVGWIKSAGLLLGEWATSRFYLVGLAFHFAGRAGFWIILLASMLALAIAWAYAHACRLHPDGIGVYVATNAENPRLSKLAAPLLFVQHTVIASVCALSAFHSFGVPNLLPGSIASFDSPALFAIPAIIAMGLLNLAGPRQSTFPVFASAAAILVVTWVVVGCAAPHAAWIDLLRRVPLSAETGHIDFVGSCATIALGLSGLEAVTNLTGVMRRPVKSTARIALRLVSIEMIASSVMLAFLVGVIAPQDLRAHSGEMVAVLARRFIGAGGEWTIRVVGGCVLLTASNIAIADLIALQYLAARDGHLPRSWTLLNRFGVPERAAIVATATPLLILIFNHSLSSLVVVVAIGVLGVVSINVAVAAIDQRLRRGIPKTCLIALATLVISLAAALAWCRPGALLFVFLVVSAAALLRSIERTRRSREVKPSRSIAIQVLPNLVERPQILMGTYGSEHHAAVAFFEAKRLGCAVAVCFIRQICLSCKYQRQSRLTIETDPAALRTLQRFHEMGREFGVEVVPIYDTGPDAAQSLARAAALCNSQKVLIGQSRQSLIYHFLKGHFQHRVECLLPPEIPVQVMTVKQAQDAREKILGLPSNRRWGVGHRLCDFSEDSSTVVRSRRETTDSSLLCRGLDD